MANRKHRDLPPFVGRLFGDRLLQAVADAGSIDEVAVMAGVKRWTVYQWIKCAKAQ
jgi:hypothetical protein